MAEITLAEMERRIEQRAQRFVANALFQIYYALVDNSPVDTGRYSSNHKLGVGQVNVETTTDTTVPALQLPSPVVLGPTYYLSNSLPYADALEHGHSQEQAPSGIYGVTVAQLQPLLGEAVSMTRAGREG